MENFNHIELTEEERNEVIRIATNEKRAKLRLEAHWKKVKEPPKIPSFTAETLFLWAKKTWEQNFNQVFIVNDDNKKEIDLLSMYFTNDPNFEKDGYSLKKGLLLMGGVGVGKTTMMQMYVKNPLCSFRIIECRKIANEYAKDGVSVVENYIGDIHPSVRNPFRHDAFGICFDDLGTESMRKNFGNETNVMEEILLSRHAKRNVLVNKTHITTNLTGDEIEEKYGARVRSRLREMFNVIEFTNVNDMRG